MSEDFEKLDREMMESLKALRKQKMPEGFLKNFSAEVERKIAGRCVRPAAGFGMGWASMLALGLAFLVLGAVIWKLLPAKRQPVVIPVTASSPTYVVPETPKTTVPLPAAGVRSGTGGSAAELLSEIEAFRELGVWTEEDEAKLGIALEETFSELELAFEDNTQIPPAPMAAG